MKKIFLVLIIITFIVSNLVYAEGVDLQKFTQETQKMSQDNKSFRLVWWIPTEYWKVAFSNYPNMTQSQKDTFYKAVDDYIVLSIIDVKMTNLGSIIPFSKVEIVNKLSLSIGQGKKMLPLSDEKLSSDTKNLFATVKPSMSNMLGQFGQGMEFVFFQGTDHNGERLLNPKSNGFFSVNYSEQSYKWRLPLGSLLPPKLDKETGEEFPGNFIYNPFTGSKLIGIK